MRGILVKVAVLVAYGGLAACGDDGGAPPDGPGGPDATDSGDARCGADLLLTGELVDFDWSEANPIGVNGAVWTVVGDEARTDTTAPNGRVEICIARTGRSQITVDVPDDPPYMDGYYIADPAVFSAGRTFSVRDASPARLQQMFEDALGEGVLPLDPTAGQLLVEVQGTAAAVALTGVASQRTLASADGAAWSEGASGRYVVFANVTPGTGTVAMDGAVGGGPVPLETNRWTMTTLAAP